MINLEHVQCFVQAVESGSFSAAARKLGKSQSSVSIAIGNLEIDLNTLLFDRTKRLPVLTKEGSTLFHQLKLLLRQAKQVTDFSVDHLGKVEDVVNIAIDPLVSMAVIENAITDTMKKYPYTRLNFTRVYADKIADAIIEGRCDAGILYSPPRFPDQIEWLSFTEGEWHFVCAPSHEFANADNVSNNELYSRRQIVCGSMSTHPIHQQTSVLSEYLCQVDELDDVVRLVEAGLGWAFIPSNILNERKALGKLVPFISNFKQVSFRFSIEFIWRSQKTAGTVLNHFHQQLREN